MNWMQIVSVYLLMVIPLGLLAGRCMAIGNIDHEKEQG